MQRETKGAAIIPRSNAELREKRVAADFELEAVGELDDDVLVAVVFPVADIVAPEVLIAVAELPEPVDDAVMVDDAEVELEVPLPLA